MNETNLTGPLSIPMTNDYLFRALLQQNNKVLKGLISSLLHLSPREITSVEITNPIELGKSIDAKYFFLDIKVLLNSDTVINLEMQVINEHNWPERSLSYLCRSFDNLNRGENYLETKPVIQISLLDFTLFPDHPEFYASYQLLNVKNYIKYSDKIHLHVLDLTRIDLATEEDRQYQIDYWAALFKATTWEELRMLAEKNDAIAEATETVYKLSEEEMIRLQCEAREDYYRRQRDAEILKERWERKIQEAKREMQENKREMQEYEQKMKENEREMQENERKIQENEQKIQENEQKMQENEQKMQEAQLKIQETERQAAILKSENLELSNQVKQLTAELEKLRAGQQVG